MARIRRVTTFAENQKLTPSLLNSLVDGAIVDQIVPGDLAAGTQFYFYQNTDPGCSNGRIWYDNTAGLEGLQYSFVSPSNASLCNWLHAFPRRTGYYWTDENVSLGTPLFVHGTASLIDGRSWAHYDGLALPRVYVASGRTEMTPEIVVAMESATASNPVRCAWHGMIQADTFGSQVTLGDMLYVDPDDPAKFKVANFNYWERGLANHWGMGEATAATRTDTVGSLHLIPTGNPPPVTGHVSGDAVSFDGLLGQDLHKADSVEFPSLSAGFWLDCWARLDVRNGAEHWVIINKHAVPSDVEWILFYNTTADRYRFGVSGNGTATTDIDADAFGAVSAHVGEWHHILCWFDSVAQQIGIVVDNGTPNTIAHTTGAFAGVAPLEVGRNAALGWGSDMSIDHVTMWTGRAAPNPWERHMLYNTGNGETGLLGGSGNVNAQIVGCSLREVSDNAVLPRAFLLWGHGGIQQDIVG